MYRTILRSICLLAIVSIPCTISLGRSPGAIDQVEEDWQVVVASPNPNEVGPQLTTCMSPVADGSTPFVALDMNYRDIQSFQPGGLQVNVYSGGTATATSTQGDELCNTSNETITWTQRLSLSSGNQFTYSIVNGQSTTWGQFGSSNGLSAVSFTATCSALASYSPDVSVAKSGAGWQSNRVASMTLLRVRYYSGGQLVSTDNNSRTVTLATASDEE